MEGLSWHNKKQLGSLVRIRHKNLISTTNRGLPRVCALLSKAATRHTKIADFGLCTDSTQPQEAKIMQEKYEESLNLSPGGLFSFMVLSGFRG